MGAQKAPRTRIGMKDPFPDDERRRHPSYKLEEVPMDVAPWIVSDELRELVEPLLPKTQRRSAIRVGDDCLTGERCRDPVRAAHGDRVAASDAGARLRLGLGCCLVCFRRLRRCS
jgi:hypothetical protein